MENDPFLASDDFHVCQMTILEWFKTPVENLKHIICIVGYFF